MGSLMAGWSSPVRDPKAVKFQRNRSLTRDEIDTYWKSKQKKEKEEEHDKVISQEFKESEKVYQRSSSMPTYTKESILGIEKYDQNANLEKLILRNGWWTSSTSAFLNEPPVIISLEESNARQNRYASQFHVARSDVSKTNELTNVNI